MIFGFQTTMNYLFQSVLLLSLIFAAVLAADGPYYSVVSPSVLRPNSNFHVAVSVQGASRSVAVTVEVTGTQDGGGPFSTQQSISVEPYSTKVLRLEIGDIGPGSYKLRAIGSGGLSFTNDTELEYVHKSYSVFIQTDKAIYKPGDLMQFRCIVLNAHLKPSVTGSLNVHITDGQGNRVKQWTRALTKRGVFAGELQLSKEPVLGDWNISVTVLDQTTSKSVLVAEYVLPRFEVAVEAPDHITFKEDKIPVTIRTKYTYGKPVEGNATITVYPIIYSGIIQPIFQLPIRKVVPVSGDTGKAAAVFFVTDELQLSDEYERTVVVDVEVEEALTGRRQNASVQVRVHKYSYRIELIKSAEYYKPGLPYEATIRISTHSGAPVYDKVNPVIVRHGWSYDSDSYTESKHMLDEHGMVSLKFTPPKDQNHTVLGIEAQYLDLKEWFSAVAAAMSPGNEFMQATIVTDKIKLNADVEVRVDSTTALKYVSYVVMGRGDVLTAGQARPSAASNNQVQFRFTATYAMAPVAHLVVYYVSDGGEMIADTVDIDVDGALQNFVEIDSSTWDTAPGKDVELRFRAKPDSYIGVLAVDQSVLLLRDGNDLSRKRISNELRMYDSGKSSPYLPLWADEEDEKPLWRPGSSTAKEAFDKSGTTVITNSLVYEQYPLLPDELLRRKLTGNFKVSTVKPDRGPPVAVLSSATRPPLAGPYAFSRIPKTRLLWNKPRIHIDRLLTLAPTWIFTNLSSGFEGRAVLRKTVPDTITSWIVSAFSVDSVYGLGLGPEGPSSRKLRVFQPFFVSLDLPYAVRRGEIVAIPIVVHNYMDRDVTVDVTLDNSDQGFDFAEVSNEVSSNTPKLELFRRKRLNVKSESGGSVSFMVTPKRVGHIPVKVTAKSPVAGDTVHRQLLVIPEGEPQYRNEMFFVDMRNQGKPFKKSVNVNIPRNAVADSEIIEISAVGDLLGPTVSNLEQLIRQPHGCGEQNMLNLVPDIVVLDYLKNVGQLTPAIEAKAIKFMETGYQQELTYKRPDGSFSAFGTADPHGSTWLTAFVAKSFRQASPYINIEPQVIDEALSWLAANQAENGSFPEVGQVSHKDMQGGAARGIALTAYVLTAFLENRRSTTNSATARLYESAIDKATNYIARNLPALDDTYATVVAAYALQLADNPSKNSALDMMKMKARTDSDRMWWTKTADSMDKHNPWLQLPNSVDVEMTSYAMLTLIEQGTIEDCIPVVKWLLAQRNSLGGFASTQDTVVALQSLSQLAKRLRSGARRNIRIIYSVKQNSSQDISVTEENSMIVQKQELPRGVRQINITAEGTGFALVQVSYRYNVNVTGPWPMFTLDPQVDRNSDIHHLQLSICSGYVGDNSTLDIESNMAVMEVSLPSGYTVDSAALPSLRALEHVKRVETKDGDTKVVLYFDKLSRKAEYCPTVSAFRTHKVAKQRPVPVTLYDYYDTSRQARMFYSPRIATLCDICEGEDCGNTCSSQPNRFNGNNNGTGGGAQSLTGFNPAIFVLITTATVVLLKLISLP